MEESDKNNRIETKMKQGTTTSVAIGYFSVVCATIWLSLLLITATFKDDQWFDGIIFISCMMFPIAVSVFLFWIYSFIRSIFWRTEANRKLLRWHLVDLLLFGVIILLVQRPAFQCDADIMAEHYDSYGPEMKRIVTQTKSLLPDSAHLSVEFDSRYNPSDDPELSLEQHKQLRRSLEDIDCIGISVDKEGKWGYTTVYFRRIGMGMYSFQLFDKPLTTEQRDSINSESCLIVYNDTTVFEYGGGVFGPQIFMKKQEFLEKLNQSPQSFK